jgi:hypothetical protein
MRRRLLLATGAFVLALGLGTPAPAAAQQSVNFFLGGFNPRGLDGRDQRDVLVQDSSFLTTVRGTENFDIGQFNGVMVGGEWLVNLGRNAEAGLGIGFYQKTVPALDSFNSFPSGDAIVQDLKLRIVPFSATVRFVPFGNRSPIQPYVGGGANIYAWRYTESGQFIDANNFIFSDTFTGSGGAVGPVILGGIRFPIGHAAVGAEIRWQGGTADLPASETFAGSKLDLGGINYLFTFRIPF